MGAFGIWTHCTPSDTSLAGAFCGLAQTEAAVNGGVVGLLAGIAIGIVWAVWSGRRRVVVIAIVAVVAIGAVIFLTYWASRPESASERGFERKTTAISVGGLDCASALPALIARLPEDRERLGLRPCGWRACSTSCTASTSP
jgi:hypothetical protein